MQNDPQVMSFLAVRRALGILGLALPIVLYSYGRVLSYGMQPSISDFYHTHMGDIVVGILVAIGIFLIAYKGYPRQPGERLSDQWVATFAGIGAIGVALFPIIPPDLAACPPGTVFEAVSPPGLTLVCPTQGFVRHWTAYAWIHFGSAALFFGCLAIFCFVLFPRGDQTPDGRIDWHAGKNRLYFGCGAAIVLTMIALLIFALLPDGTRTALKARNYVFWWETVAVVAFATSWLAKGKVAEALRGRAA